MKNSEFQDIIIITQITLKLFTSISSQIYLQIQFKQRHNFAIITVYLHCRVSNQDLLNKVLYKQLYSVNKTVELFHFTKSLNQTKIWPIYRRKVNFKNCYTNKNTQKQNTFQNQKVSIISTNISSLQFILHVTSRKYTKLKPCHDFIWTPI